jgi:hypothetical protein
LRATRNDDDQHADDSAAHDFSQCDTSSY